MINVLALYADRAGCGDYRVRFPAAAVNAQEHELGVHVETADHLDADATETATGFRIRRVDIPNGIDVVSFQRPTRAVLAGAIQWLKHYRPDLGLVVELDDDLANVPTTNAAHASLSHRFSPAENYRWLRKSIALAHVLTVSTPMLAEIYGASVPRSVVIRNAVEASMCDQPARAIYENRQRSDGSERIIGWAGSVATHGGDLDVTGGALSDIVGQTRADGRRVSFRQVGPRDGLAEALRIPDETIQASGWLTPQMYRVSLSELDVGIVPLASSRFNSAKSALKVLEMAAAGVPVVASHTPEHDQLRRDGMPIWLVRDRRRQWASALNHILDLNDTELRELAIVHREFVRKNHTVEVRAPEWANAWKAAHRIARAG